MSRRSQQGSNPNDYFGIRNKHKFGPKAGTNYTTASLRTSATRREADTIAGHITGLFADPFAISLYPAGFGDLIFALAENSNVVTIYTDEPDYNNHQMLQNNLRSYDLGKKVQVGKDYQREEASILLLDLVKDPNYDLITTLNEAKFPAYALRTVLNYPLPVHPGYMCTLEVTNNPQTQLILCTPQEAVTSVDDEYIAGLKSFIDQLLAKIISNPQEREEYFTPERMSEWINAFTNKTFDAQSNYEVHEMLGDRAMKFAFAYYLIQRIPGITEEQLTDLQNYFLTKIPQSQLAKDLGFGEYIRTMGGVKTDMLEDVLEAFFGALFVISEDVKGGLGFFNTFSMLVALYKNIPFEEEINIVRGGRKKTVFVQTLSGLGLDPVTENIYDEGGVYYAELSLSPRNIRYFSEFGITLPRVIAKTTGTSKANTTMKAYSEALDLLRSKGVTPDWVKEQKEIRAFNRPEFQPYLATARTRLAREGFEKMEFHRPTSASTTHECIAQLIGIRPDGSKEILASTQVCTNYREGKIQVLRAYAEGK
jgi:hypothetical protein